MEFFQAGKVADDGYRNVRDLPHLSDLKALAETLWGEYAHLADDHFLEDAKSHFQERFWEMYLAVSLIRRGYKLKKGCNSGPDFVVSLESETLQLEATAPGPGTGKDAVPKMKTGTANRVPDNEIVLRIRSALRDKLTQFEHALDQGIVQETDAYIVAINGIRIRESISEGSIPFVLKAVFPFGDLNVVWNKESNEVTGSYYSHRPTIAKKSGVEIRTDIFNTDEYCRVSAVLYTRCDCANHAEEFGDEFQLVHNPQAVNPIARGTFRFGREYWADDEEVHCSNWNENAA